MLEIIEVAGIVPRDAAGWRADGGLKVEDFGDRTLVELRYRLVLTTNS